MEQGGTGVVQLYNDYNPGRISSVSFQSYCDMGLESQNSEIRGDVRCYATFPQQRIRE
jgi:hypothetical protein